MSTKSWVVHQTKELYPVLRKQISTVAKRGGLLLELWDDSLFQKGKQSNSEEVLSGVAVMGQDPRIFRECHSLFPS
jgi:hypothetical protein